MRKLFLLVVALVPWLGAGVAHALSPDDLLPPEKAFALSVRALDAQTVEARWKIADGYYLYRDKFKFESADPGVGLKPALIPAGIKKHDPNFGEVETYRQSVAVKIPVDGAVNAVDVRITAQGCADAGVCYPPQTQTVKVALPLAIERVANVGTVDTLKNWLRPGAQQQQFLDPDQAFVLKLVPQDANSIRADIDIAQGYYLYRDKIRFEVAGPAGARLGTYTLPPGQVKDDPNFGRLQVYHGRVATRLPIEGAAGFVELIAHYQGCAEQGICYPPTTKKVRLDLPGQATTADLRVDTGGLAPASVNGKTMWLAILAAFGTGLLLTFTPCVLPMVPILSSVIVGSSTRRVTKLEGGMLSASYVLGTAVTYTAAGALAGATGEQLQAYFQNIWAIGFLAIVFVLLALSMFGIYELHMPAAIQSALHKHSADIHLKTKHTKVGAYIGVFGMGLVAALIVGACVSPLVISALGVAIANRDPVLGGAIMFAMALGMGVFLIALGIGAGYVIPKAGPWMNTVKHIFGVLLIAVAIYLLGALPEVPVLFLWSALLIVIAVYLGATQSLPRDANGWRYLWKGVGTFLFMWGILALLGGLAGNRDILRPITLGQLTAAGTATSNAAAQANAPLFQRIKTVAELEQGLARAKAAGRPVIVDFYADWCTDCVRMERVTFADPRVRSAMQRFVLLQADVTDTNDTSRDLKQRLSVLGPPAMVFFSGQGQPRDDLRIYGFQAPDPFLRHLASI
jgi:thiol:disulfide interchange protein DsbD